MIKHFVTEVLNDVYIWMLLRMVIRNGIYNPDNSLYHLKQSGTVLIIVPHEDDEIIVAGNLIKLLGDNYSYYLVFYTNGDYFFSGNIRFKEALKSIHRLIHAKSCNVYTLGYPDSGDKVGDSIIKKGVNDSNNTRFTHGNKYIDDYSFLRTNKHKQCTFEGLINDISNMIIEFMPDILVCNACDKHIDHMVLSLAFDKAFGIIKKIHPNYNPLVLKRFAYDFCYYSPMDYCNNNNLDTPNPIKSEELKLQSRLYGKYEYLWDERIRLPLARSNQNRCLANTAIYRALKSHKSQRNIRRAKSILNADDVFINRRTDNLAFKAKIYASSGDCSSVNDFLLYSMKDLGLQDSYDTNEIWHPAPEDTNKELVFVWDSSVDVENINIYGNINDVEGSITDMEVLIENEIIYRGKGPSDGKQLRLYCSAKEVFRIVIKIISATGYYGISEVELFSDRAIDSFGNSVSPYVKLLINENFAYEYLYNPGDVIALSSYCSNSQSQANICVVCGDAKVEDNLLVVGSKTKKPIVLQTKTADGLWDQVVLVRSTHIARIIKYVFHIYDEMTLYKDVFIESVVYKWYWTVTIIHKRIKLLMHRPEGECDESII